MFLRRLSITDVAGLGSLKLDFTTDGDVRRRTVIVGENGAGKSRLLQAIALATAGSSALAGLMPRPGEWVTPGRTKARITVELKVTARRTTTVSIDIHAKDDIGGLLARNRDALSELDKVVARKPLAFFVAGYGVSRRLSRRSCTRDPRMDPRAGAVATLLDPTADLPALVPWAIELSHRNGEGGLQTLRAVLSRLLSSLGQVHLDPKSGALAFEGARGSPTLDELSDGERTTVAWAGDLALRLTEAAPAGGDASTTPGVLLLDELGLHLHPKRQREIADAITAALPKFQIIGTTQGPAVAQQMAEGEVWVRTPEGVEPMTGDPRKLFLHQLLGTPAFGEVPVTSAYVLAARAELATLSSIREPTRAQKRRRAALQDELSTMPRWRTSGDDAERLALYGRIDEALTALGQGREGGTGRRTRGRGR